MKAEYLQRATKSFNHLKKLESNYEYLSKYEGGVSIFFTGLEFNAYDMSPTFIESVRKAVLTELQRTIDSEKAMLEELGVVFPEDNEEPAEEGEGPDYEPA